MKRTDIKNLHQKSIVDLEKELMTYNQQLIKLNLDAQIKPEKNTRLRRSLRDSIARVKTILVMKKEPKKV